jgi:hypothetical protein
MKKINYKIIKKVSNLELNNFLRKIKISKMLHGNIVNKKI